MSNIREFFHSTIGGEVTASGEGLPEDFKCLILCAYDLRKEFDWDEIEGVRRVTEIRFYSDAVNATYGTNVYLKRRFLYDVASPRDLAEVIDALVPL
jgi:hypothetical protein